MAKVTTYKNSKFATFLSFLGYIGIAIGVYSIFQEDIGFGVGAILLVIGFGLKFLANLIGNKKDKKTAEENRGE